MKNNLISLLLILICTVSSFSQNKKDVLLSIDGSPVYISEFKRVYKKNLDLVQDESQKNIDGYLDLFIDYKLKVAEAYDQKLNETPTYKKEFLKYQNQLSRNYLYEDKVTEDLAVEAYERGTEEIEAAHILIKSSIDDLPQDTIKAYNRIKEALVKARNGTDFGALVKEYSEEPGAKEREGDLGYFSVFKMVYPFETAAYNTKAGEVSDIVRTQFGYHIIKVNDRRKVSPPVSVSHIMISDKEENRTFDPKERIDDLYAKINQGENFEDIAKQFSEDKGSAKQGGKIKSFSKGELRSPNFEKAAYDLMNPGDISEPVKSKFGWHIIKLNEKFEVPTYDQVKGRLLKRVTDGGRSKIVVNAVNDQIKSTYNYKQGESYEPFFTTYATEDIKKGKWIYDTIAPANDKVLFTIGEHKLHFNDFAQYINDHQGKGIMSGPLHTIVNRLYEQFENEELKDYFKIRLEIENEDYGATIKEYRDGLLIYDVMNLNIWNKAKSDTVALKNYYEQHKSKYVWGKRFEATIISTATKSVAMEAMQMLQSSKTGEEIKEKLNANKVNIIVSEGRFEMDDRALPNNFTAKEGVSEIYEQDASFIVVNVDRVIPSEIKTFEETKGRVISDYQSHLENTWMTKLRNKYKVDINKKALKRVKKDLNS